MVSWSAACYVDRRLRRIVEDASGISPEASNAGISADSQLLNVNANTDLWTNEIQYRYAMGSTKLPAGCDPSLTLDPVQDSLGNNLGAVCFAANGKNGFPVGSLIPDRVPDGFANPIRIYQAAEIEINKGFSHNFQMRANWRISRLFGNYEGAFRNDNGQADPGISSLFDFTQGTFGLLGDQFKPGLLNSDRRQVVGFFPTYVLDKSKAKGLEIGAAIRIQSGIPYNDLKAHPAYLNAGEVPVGGRGALGRMPASGGVDLHIGYPVRLTERLKLNLGMDLFNIANRKTILQYDQNEDASFGVPNVDFKTPIQFQRPFYARAMLRLVF